MTPAMTGLLMMMAALLLAFPAVLAFTVCPVAMRSTKWALAMKAEGEGISADRWSRREAIQAAGAAAFGSVLAVTAPSPSFAVDLSSINQRLSNYGLPEITDVPNGMRPLLEIYGKDEIRETLLVSWNYPNGWLVQRPNNDLNYEDGTVSTGDYGKGDTAYFWVGSKDLVPGGTIDKAAASAVLQKAIGQKGENQYQSFSLRSLKEGAPGLNGQKYYIARFSYELLTGAGFSIDREGYASITSIGSGVQAVVGATTFKRFKTLEPKLKEVAESFRVYTGILK